MIPLNIPGSRWKGLDRVAPSLADYIQKHYLRSAPMDTSEPSPAQRLAALEEQLGPDGVDALADYDGDDPDRVRLAEEARALRAQVEE